MYGSGPFGHWSSLKGPNCGREHQFLRADRWYRVAKGFVDFDGDNHDQGERWIGDLGSYLTAGNVLLLAFHVSPAIGQLATDE